MFGPNTLIVNRTDSYCGSCGRSALPSETHHTITPGLSGEKPGCGDKFIYIASGYTMMKDKLTKAYPHLIWAGFEP